MLEPMYVRTKQDTILSQNPPGIKDIATLLAPTTILSPSRSCMLYLAGLGLATAAPHTA